MLAECDELIIKIKKKKLPTENFRCFKQKSAERNQPV